MHIFIVFKRKKMENKFLHNNQTNSLFNSAYQASNKCFKQAAITDLSIHSDVLKNTSILSKSIKMKYPTSSIQQAQNLNGYSICTASNNNNFQMKNTKFTSFVFALMAMLLMITSKNAMASPGNRIFIGLPSPGAVPAAGEMHFCEPDTFRFQITNLTNDPLSNVVAHLVFLERNPSNGAIDSTQEFVKYVGNLNGYTVISSSPGKVDLAVPDLAPNESRTIEVLGYLTCSGYFAIKNGKVMRNFYKTSYLHLGLPNWDERFTIDYFPQVPQLIVSNVTPSSINGTFGTTFFRDVTIVNGGFGKLKEFLIQDLYGSSVVIDSIRTGDGILVTNASGTLQVLIDSALIAAKYGSDTLFGQNKTWVIREYVRVVNCDPIAARSRINAKFGCNYDGPGFCDSSATFNANVVFGAPVPNLVYTRRNDYNKSCPEVVNDQTQTLIIRNTGTASAVDVFANLIANERNDGIPYSYANSVIDTNSITVRYNNGTPFQPFIYSYDTVYNYDGNWDALFRSCFPTYKIKKVQIRLADIPVGDSVIITFKLDNCSVTSDKTYPIGGCLYPRNGAWSYKLTYADPCRLVPVNNAWTASMSHQTHYTRWSQQSPAEMYGVDQDSILYTMTQQYFYYHFYSGVWDTVPGEYYEMRITVDKGLFWESSRMPEMVHNIGNLAVDSIHWMANTVVIDSLTNPSQIVYSFKWNLPPPKAWTTYRSSTQWMLGSKLNLILNSTCDYGGGSKAVKREDFWFTGGNTAQSCVGSLQSLNCAYSVPINIKCPGCVTGIANIEMDVYRKNYGLQDFNNDGIPDSNIPASDTSAGVLRTTAMYGDTLILKTLGVVYRSTPLPFTNAYGRILFNDNIRFVDPAGGYVVIKSAALGTTYTCDIVNFRKVGSELYYDYSPLALAANGCGIPSNYTFEQGDSIWTYPYIKLDQNIGNTNVERQFDHTLYVADRDVSAYTLGTKPACNYNTGNLGADTSCHAYYCNTNQDNFNFVGYALTYDNNGFRVVRGCEVLEDYRQFYLYVGGSWNVRPFSNEIRRMVYPREWYVSIPQGYKVNSARVIFNSVTAPFLTTSKDVNPYPFTQIGDSVYVNTDTSHVSSGGSTFRDYIDGWVEALRLNITPSCLVPPKDTLLSQARALLDDKYLQIFAPDSWSNYFDGTGPNMTDLNNSYIDTAFYNSTKTFSYPYRYQDWNYGGTTNARSKPGYIVNAYEFDAPVMRMQAVQPIVDVFKKGVRWELVVTNFSGTAAANNVWIANNIAGSGITVDSVELITNPANIVPVGGIYQLGNFAATQEKRYYIYGDYTKCDLDTFIVNLGWNCQGYPANLPAYPCTPYKLSLGTDPKPADLQTQLVQDVDTMSLCDTATYEFRIKATNLSSVYHVATKIVLANGFAIIPGSSEMKYPQNGTYSAIPDPVISGGNTSTYYIDSLNTPQADWLEANGLPGLGVINPLTGGDSTYVYYRFKFTTFCDNGQTPSNKRIVLSSQGESWCGELTDAIRVATRPIVLRGSSQPYFADLQIRNANIHGCDTLANRSTILFTNLGNPPSGPNNPTGLNDTIYLTIPVSVNLVGSVQVLYTPAGSSGGLVGPFLVPGDDPAYHTYKWRLPQNVTYLDSVVFSIKMVGASETECSDYLQAYLEASANDAATCKADGLTCDVKYFNGFNEVGLAVTKPILTFSNPKVTSIPSPPANEIATMCIDITNSGDNLLAGDPIVVNFYADTNQDGAQDAGDILLDSSTYTLGLNSGATITICKTFTAPVQYACNYVAKLSNTTCACTLPEIGNISSPLLINLGGDKTACSKTTVTIGTDSLNGYTYDWIPSSYITCPTCPTTDVNLPINIGTTNDTLTYILRTTRSQLCTSEDTINIIVQPQPNIVATPSSATLCSGPPPFSADLTSQLPGTTITWTTEAVPFVSGNKNGSGTQILDTLYNTDSVNRVVIYKVVGVSSLGCVSDTTIVTVTVYPTVTFVVQPLTQIICSGDTATINMSSAVDNVIYTYTASGLNAIPGGGSQIKQKLINTTGDTVRVFYTITGRANSCVNQVVIASVLVYPAPVIQATPNISPLCSGQTTNIDLTSNVLGTTFQWTTAPVTGISGNFNGNGSTIVQTLTNSTAAPLEVIYIITPTSLNGCKGDTIWARVTVNPVVTAIATPSTQTICTGETTNLALTSSPTGATFTWTASGLNATAGSGSTISQTLVNGTAAPVNVVYSITAMLNGCPSVPLNTTVIVNPAPIGTATPASSTICSGGNVSSAFTSNIVGTTFAWTTAPVSGISGNSDGSGSSLSQTLTSTNTTPTSVTYIVTPIGPISLGSCLGAPFNVSVVVNPTPQVTITNNNDSLCSGEASRYRHSASQ
jgi:hypothetical protein